MIKVYQKIEFFTLRIIEKLENQRRILTAWLVSFYAIYFLRVLLAAYSERKDYFLFENFFKFVSIDNAATFLFWEFMNSRLKISKRV